MWVLAGFVMIQQIISVRNVRGRRGLEKQHITPTPLRPPPVPSPVERMASRGQHLTPREGDRGGAPLGGAGGELTGAAVVELVTTGLLAPNKKQVSRAEPSLTLRDVKNTHTIVVQNA